MRLLRRCALTLCLVASSHPAVAQSTARTSVAFDVAIGGADGGGGEYRDRGIMGARLALSVRRRGNPGVDRFAEVSMDWLGWTSGHYAICFPSSRGGCVPSYPELSGPTLIAGVLSDTRNRRFQGRFGIGGGAYAEPSGPRVGAAIAQGDAAWFPFSHIGIVGGARWILVPRYLGDKLTIVPRHVGLRIR